MKICTLFDRFARQGDDPDHQDTLKQAGAVGNGLKGLGHAALEAEFDLDLKGFTRRMKSLNPDLVFNLVESVEGCGRLIYLAPAMLDLLGIPYTGNSTDALFLTSNKLATKKILQGQGIPSPTAFSPEDLRSPCRVEGEFIIKSVWEHASIGIGEDSVVSPQNREQLCRELDRRRRVLGGDCFAERYVEGREFNLSLLGGAGRPEVLPPAEILFDAFPPGKKRLVCYRAKWDETSFEYRHTLRSFDFPPGDAPLLERLRGLAEECWRLFRMRGYARVDFRVDQDNSPWVLEVNANPCLSPDAGFVAAASRAGLDIHEILRRIIRDAGIETDLSSGPLQARAVESPLS
ncbi:MAG: ATP-grasp domain-containing protein [Deltaproteobacteria bacterium]|nr:ATP-grasp domain-containing protein [Deltaproteobacteria bacterium]